MADYFSQADLEAALSLSVVRAAYSDDNSNTASATGIAGCIAYGGAMCDSFMRNVLTSGGETITLPIATGVPAEVKFAALDFGIAYTMRRRPDVVRAMSELPWTEFYDKAVEQMKRYCASQQRFPATTGTHATAGATLLNPDSDEDGAEEDLPDESRWADMADF